MATRSSAAGTGPDDVAEAPSEAIYTMAAYLDKTIVLYKGGLYIGTTNTEQSGEIWRRLRMVYLPFAAR